MDNANREKTKEELEAEHFEKVYLKEMEEKKVEAPHEEQVESVERKSRRQLDSHLDSEMNEIRVMELNYEKDELMKGIN